MSVKNSALVKQGQEETSQKLTAADIQEMKSEGAIESGSKVDFDNLQGETFAGLNLLNLEVGEADGPFKLVSIKDKDFGTGKAKKTLPQYSTMKGTTPVIMPISASFLTKAVEAKLVPGNVFYVKRDKNFTSKEFGTENCKLCLRSLLLSAIKVQFIDVCG